jgi:hypothetical protein
LLFELTFSIPVKHSHSRRYTAEHRPLFKVPLFLVAGGFGPFDNVSIAKSPLVEISRESD